MTMMFYDGLWPLVLRIKSPNKKLNRVTVSPPTHISAANLYEISQREIEKKN